MRPGGPTAQPLPSTAGPRWHWQHGPIDLVVGADGEPAAVAQALEAAWQRFDGLLAELVAELPALRRPLPAPGQPFTRHGLQPDGQALDSRPGPDVGLDAGALAPFPQPPAERWRSPVAHRMAQVCGPLAALGFITPMAAVAGAVAEAVLAPLQRPGLRRAWVNNGGDVAVHLAEGAAIDVGVADVDAAGAFMAAGAVPAGVDGVNGLNGPNGPGSATAALAGTFRLTAAHPARGLATSGWSGRSLSFGIADRVTVLAARAADADALATVIANAVNVNHPGIHRVPARDLRDDSDLGDRLVTAAVPPLPPAACDEALARGLACAQRLQRAGLVHAAWLCVQGRSRVLAPHAAAAPASAGRFGAVDAAVGAAVEAASQAPFTPGRAVPAGPGPLQLVQ